MNRRQKGFSLIELMIALVAGLIVMGAVLSFTVSMVRSNAELIDATRLSQDLRTAAGMIGRELRRAGYDQLALRRVSTGIFDSDYSPVTILNNGSCLVLGYDTQVGNQWKGFRFRDNAMQFARFADRPDACDQDGGWTAITNTAGVRVTEFLVEEMCGGAVGACAAIPSDDGNNEIDVRNYRITLTGGSTIDQDLSRRVITQIRVRADAVTTLEVEEEEAGV